MHAVAFLKKYTFLLFFCLSFATTSFAQTANTETDLCFKNAELQNLPIKSACFTLLFKYKSVEELSVELNKSVQVAERYKRVSQDVKDADSIILSSTLLKTKSISAIKESLFWGYLAADSDTSRLGLNYASNAKGVKKEELHSLCNEYNIKFINCDAYFSDLPISEYRFPKEIGQYILDRYANLLSQDYEIVEIYSYAYEDYALIYNSLPISDKILTLRSIVRGDAGRGEDSLNAYLYKILKLDAKFDKLKYLNTAHYLNKKYELNLSKEDLLKINRTGDFLRNIKKPSFNREYLPTFQDFFEEYDKVLSR